MGRNALAHRPEGSRPAAGKAAVWPCLILTGPAHMTLRVTSGNLVAIEVSAILSSPPSLFRNLHSAVRPGSPSSFRSLTGSRGSRLWGPIVPSGSRWDGPKSERFVLGDEGRRSQPSAPPISSVSSFGVRPQGHTPVASPWGHNRRPASDGSGSRPKPRPQGLVGSRSVPARSHQRGSGASAREGDPEGPGNALSKAG